jgi:hypothetical protein
MAVDVSVARERELAHAASLAVDPSSHDHARRRAAWLRIQDLSHRGAVMQIGVVVGGLALALVASPLLLLALVVAGPFFLSAILVLAGALVAVVATGASG